MGRELPSVESGALYFSGIGGNNQFPALLFNGTGPVRPKIPFAEGSSRRPWLEKPWNIR